MPYFTNAVWIRVSELPETGENIGIVVDHPLFQRLPGHTMIRYIGVQCEPEAVTHSRQRFIDNHKTFDTILTYDNEILKACPNARYCTLTNSWISPSTYNNINISRKQRKISCLTGKKKKTEGHEFRIRLYTNQTVLFFPITWFRSSRDPKMLPAIGNNPVIGDSKDHLFLDYQFSIAIENSRQPNYFTEKLLDCLITKTIPIYWGCPNISNWFDTRGWIILETTSIDEFRLRCSRLPDYSQFINVINENYERAKQYANFETNIQRAMNFGVGTRESTD